MLVKLLLTLVEVALHGGLFYRAVHALDLAIRPGMSHFSAAVFNACCCTIAVKGVAGWRHPVGQGRKLYPIVRQYSMYLVRYCRHHALPKSERRGDCRFRGQFGKSELAGSVHGHKQIMLAFSGVQFGKIQVKIADGIVLKFLLFRRHRLCFLRQPADAVPFKKAMQRRARQVRNGVLQGVEAVIQAELHMLAKQAGGGCLGSGEYRRNGRFWSHRGVLRTGPVAPFAHGLLVQTVLAGQRGGTGRTGLQELANGRRRAGAAV